MVSGATTFFMADKDLLSFFPKQRIQPKAVLSVILDKQSG